MESYGRVYRTLIDEGLETIMTGQISLPAVSRKLRPGIRDAEIMPASLAPELLQDLLRGELGFNGLIISDASSISAAIAFCFARSSEYFSVNRSDAFERHAPVSVVKFSSSASDAFCLRIAAVSSSSLQAEPLSRKSYSIFCVKVITLYERMAPGSVIASSTDNFSAASYRSAISSSLPDMPLRFCRIPSNSCLSSLKYR